MIYLSGKIRGLHPQEVTEKFMNKWKELRTRYGGRVVNPVLFMKDMNSMRMRAGMSILTDVRHRKEIMKICIDKLSECDTIYLMPCWEDSEGAQAELAFAKSAGMKIIYELENLEE